jgi:hypothetical protein
MGDGRFPFEVVNGVPVVAAPEEIDITNAPALGRPCWRQPRTGTGRSWWT